MDTFFGFSAKEHAEESGATCGKAPHLVVLLQTMDKIFGRQVELLAKDGAASAGPPEAAKVIGLLFASTNAETAQFVERVAGACAKLLEHGKVFFIVYIPLDADDATAREAMPAHFVALPQRHAPLRDKVWSEQQLSSSPSLVLSRSRHVLSRAHSCSPRVILLSPILCHYFVPR